MKRLAMNPLQVCWLALAIVAAFGPGGCGGGSASQSDAGNGESDAGNGGSDAAMPDGSTGAMGNLRFLHASPRAGNLDIYLHGEPTPIVAGIGYGATSASQRVPAGMVQLDVRVTGTSATASPMYTSPPITVSIDGSVTAIAAGVVATDPTMPPPPETAFRVLGLADAFATAAPGKTRIRVVNTMYSLAAVTVDLGDDGTPDIASMDRLTVSDAAGLEVAAGAELSLGVLSTDAAHTRVGSFVVPAAQLGDSANVYVVLSGLTTFPARDPRGAVAIAVRAPGSGPPLVVRPNPVVYLLAASPDASSIDGYLGTRKLFSGLAFGKLGSSPVLSTTTGHALDLRPAGADPTTAPLVSLSTGMLHAGEQYLAVLTGLVNPTGASDALALDVYRDDMLDLNDFGRMRVINAGVGVGMIDAGRYSIAGGPAWVDVADFAAIPAGGASPSIGTTMDTSIVPAPVTLGARLSSEPGLALRFDTIPGLNPFDRFFAVLAGAWSPVGSQVPARYILVKTAAINPWSTAILPAVPGAITVAPQTADVILGSTQQYTATAVFGNGTTQAVTATATWSSLAPAIAQMSASTRGLATAKAVGSTTISAKLGTVTGTAAITVLPVQSLTVSATQPGDGASGVAADTSITVAFSQAISPATLVAQTAAGACSGTLQLSADGFATCTGFAAAAPTMDAANTIATAQPAAPLTGQATYQLRVAGTVANAAGVPMGADFTQATGFRITCAGNLVISQIYGGGSAAGGVYRNDFIELHNIGGAPADLTGYAVQSGLATGATWNRQALPSAVIPPGGYFLIQEGGGTSMTQLELPTPDAAPPGPLNLNGMNGKVALALSPTAFAVSCPLTSVPPLPVTDLVGYGPTANCFEGAAATAVLANATAAVRNDDGCSDTNANSADLAVAAPTPRNSASPVRVCSCPN
jgi:hypothetical protein